MNQTTQLTKTPVDIKTLITTSNMDVYDKNKFIEKLQQHFSEDEQKLYVCHLFLYLNYHPTNDYVVNLENVWKFIGFANKGNGMKTMKNNFVKDEDYKILLRSRDKQVVFRREKNPNVKDVGGRPEEIVMLNVDTFKNLCMIAKTEQGKKIRKYYVKLEMVYSELIKEEMKHELETSKKLLETLQNKPDTFGFLDRKPGYNYIIKDTSRTGHYKIGYAIDTYSRLAALNTSSSTCSLEIVHRIHSLDKEISERIIHNILQPFRIRNDNQKNNEWFYFKDDFELSFAVKVLQSTVEFTNSFIYKDYNHFKTQSELTHGTVPDESANDTDLNDLQNNQNDTINEYILQNNTSTSFKGVNWVQEKKKWKAEFQYKAKRMFLGYFIDQIDAAKVYNDYALYLNQTENANLILNDIPGYQTTPRNVPELNKIKKTNGKTSQYIGVSYDSTRKHFLAGIKHCRKSYILCFHQDEVECAKIYNMQAMFFNNTFNTNYQLNDIANYVTVPKDLREDKKQTKKSKYYGVSLTRTGKWVCQYAMNGKKVHIGTYDIELDAAKAYNKVVSELNKNGCNYVVNINSGIECTKTN